MWIISIFYFRYFQFKSIKHILFVILLQTVDAEKCLGTRLDISTENGDVNVGSNYCEKSTFSTLNGNLLLNNLHMDSAIDINGNGSLNISE